MRDPGRPLKCAAVDRQRRFSTGFGGVPAPLMGVAATVGGYWVRPVRALGLSGPRGSRVQSLGGDLVSIGPHRDSRNPQYVGTIPAVPGLRDRLQIVACPGQRASDDSYGSFSSRLRKGRGVARILVAPTRRARKRSRDAPVCGAGS